MVARTRAELDAALEPTRGVGRAAVALVPTMGALHPGHAALLRQARGHVGGGGAVVASVFVNPLQFAAGEDLDRYPRTFELHGPPTLVGLPRPALDTELGRGLWELSERATGVSWP